MSEKFIEFIKRILQKTVLPLRKKSDEILRKFYLSIAFRIAFYYVRLFIIFGVVFFVIVYGVYVELEVSRYNRYADNIVNTLKGGQAVIQENLSGEAQEEAALDELSMYRKRAYKESINPYEQKGITIRIRKGTDGPVVYSDIEDDAEEDRQLFNMLSYNYKDNQKVLIKKRRTYELAGTTYQVYLQFDITDSINNLHNFLLFLILLYFVLVLLVAKFGQRGIERLLQPLKNMSATANRLTVNNLHSERLNVAGTKNELKELAGTMNSMLDRIELSYESQKQFVSDASHELRTPIAVIQGYANMLARWGMNDKEVLEESVEAITNEAKSMKDLVEKLLFLSRHDKKTLHLERKLFNMKDVVEEMVRETKMVVENRSITTPVLQNVIVYGDQQALKQAVRIFIDNAVKYSENGDSIKISCRNEEGTCIVTVEDTGIGMKKEDMNKIFERFYRADNVRNGGVEGQGLGLSIAKLIVLNHTGTIKVRSQFTKGSSFSIILPDYYRKGFVK